MFTGKRLPRASTSLSLSLFLPPSVLSVYSWFNTERRETRKVWKQKNAKLRTIRGRLNSDGSVLIARNELVELLRLAVPGCVTRMSVRDVSTYVFRRWG